jgi:hypothetical protein
VSYEPIEIKFEKMRQPPYVPPTFQDGTPIPYGDEVHHAFLSHVYGAILTEAETRGIGTSASHAQTLVDRHVMGRTPAPLTQEWVDTVIADALKVWEVVKTLPAHEHQRCEMCGGRGVVKT